SPAQLLHDQLLFVSEFFGDGLMVDVAQRPSRLFCYSGNLRVLKKHNDHQVLVCQSANKRKLTLQTEYRLEVGEQQQQAALRHSSSHVGKEQGEIRLPEGGLLIVKRLHDLRHLLSLLSSSKR